MKYVVERDGEQLAVDIEGGRCTVGHELAHGGPLAGFNVPTHLLLQLVKNVYHGEVRQIEIL